jgi:hypothetical protein
VGTSRPSREIRSAIVRSRPSRRSSVLESAVASRIAARRPTPAGEQQAVADLVDERV